MDTRNNNRPFSSQTSSQRLYEDDHEEVSRICRESGRKPAEEIRDLVSEALSARRNRMAGITEIAQKLDQLLEQNRQLVEQNRLATEGYERFLQRSEQLEERSVRLKQGLVQNLREFYAILIETLSTSIGARRLVWGYVAHTVLKQTGLNDEQITERYEAERRAWIEERDNLTRALDEAIKKMPPQQ